MLNKRSGRSASLVVATNIAFLLLSAACSIDAEKERDGEYSRVDIRTPVGRIEANKNPRPEETGLAVYPGARLVTKDDNGKENANVNLSFGDHKLRVIALRFESDDPSGKIITFYKDQLRKYGDVLECQPDGSHMWNGKREHDSPDRDVDCDDTDESGRRILQLKVGGRQTSRIVTVEPKGRMTEFALVYIQASGDEPI